MEHHNQIGMYVQSLEMYSRSDCNVFTIFGDVFMIWLQCIYNLWKCIYNLIAMYLQSLEMYLWSECNVPQSHITNKCVIAYISWIYLGNNLSQFLLNVLAISGDMTTIFGEYDKILNYCWKHHSCWRSVHHLCTIFHHLCTIFLQCVLNFSQSQIAIDWEHIRPCVSLPLIIKN